MRATDISSTEATSKVDEVFYIKLGGKRGGYALIDAALTKLASKYSWRQNFRGYVVTNLPRGGAKVQTQFLLHHLVLGKPNEGLVVDHINHNKLDNRVANLRHCTNAENQRNQKLSVKNSTGYKGVFPGYKGKFRACIWVEGKSKKLGQFGTAQEAHRAYMEAAHLYFGDFANAK